MFAPVDADIANRPELGAVPPVHYRGAMCRYFTFCTVVVMTDIKSKERHQNLYRLEEMGLIYGKCCL